MQENIWLPQQAEHTKKFCIPHYVKQHIDMLKYKYKNLVQISVHVEYIVVNAFLHLLVVVM
jgi:hypothetical protein